MPLLSVYFAGSSPGSSWTSVLPFTHPETSPAGTARHSKLVDRRQQVLEGCQGAVRSPFRVSYKTIVLLCFDLPHVVL